MHLRDARPHAVMPAEDPRRTRLEREGWVVVAESFGAQVALGPGALEHLRPISAPPPGYRFAALGESDVPAILALDAATVGDYPGGPATRHLPLDETSACPTASRRMHGAFDAGGTLVAMTVMDLASAPPEVDLTVVAAGHRRRGIARGLKAAGLLALGEAGVTCVRTGGAVENTAIRAANARLGFVEDERWVTLAPGGQSRG